MKQLMAQQSGIIVVDKLEGKSSAFVDFIIKRQFGVKKVGHIGTLDPFATGVLAIAINGGTKAIPYIKTKSKTYEFGINFGKRTDTSDKTGKVVEISDRIPTDTEIKAVLPQFIGEISQVPSIFSAIKKRPVTIDQVSEIADYVENHYANALKTIARSKEIGELVLEKLRDLDPIAYIRFASVYEDFTDTASFVAKISEIDKR